MDLIQAEKFKELLAAYRDGDDNVAAELFALAYQDLRIMARHMMRRERPDHTLQTTALVHEVYLRLFGEHQVEWQNEEHFFVVAARQMRRILVDHARRRNELKHGGKAVQISLTAVEKVAPERSTDVLALDEALQRLAAFDLRKSHIVELRFFGGLSESETAEVLKTSLRTVQREWNLARAWLYQQLRNA